MVPPKSSECQLVSKFWDLELFWRDLLCNLTLITFWAEPVKKNTLYFARIKNIVTNPLQDELWGDLYSSVSTPFFDTLCTEPKIYLLTQTPDKSPVDARNQAGCACTQSLLRLNESHAIVALFRVARVVDNIDHWSINFFWNRSLFWESAT